MKKVILSVCLLATTMFTFGCANINDANQMIADSNKDRLTEFSGALIGCGENAACQVAVSMAFASNMGQQQLFRPDTALDFFKAGLPYATLGIEAFKIFKAAPTIGDQAGINIVGDNNQLSGINNKLTADNKSSISASFMSTPTVEHTAIYDMYNRTFTTGSSKDTLTDTGITPTE